MYFFNNLFIFHAFRVLVIFVFLVLVFRRSGIPAFRHSSVPCFSTSRVAFYYFDPSQIATEGFCSSFISLKYTDQHMKSQEKSKKRKIHFFTETIQLYMGRMKTRLSTSTYSHMYFFDQQFTTVQSSELNGQ